MSKTHLVKSIVFGGKLSFAFLVAGALAGFSLNAQRPVKDRKGPALSSTVVARRGVDRITAAQMRSFLSFIAADEMEGRDTPSRGLDLTAQFLAINLARWGFKPAGSDGSFFQPIALRHTNVDSAGTFVELNGQRFKEGEEYIPSPVAGSVSGELIFAGNGWLIKSKDVDAYKGVDARGKVAVIFAPPGGYPRMLRQRESLGKQGEDWMNATDYALKQGVAGIVYVPDFQFLANWESNRQRIMERGLMLPDKFFKPGENQIPSIIASPKLANAIFQGEAQNAAALFESAYGSGAVLANSFALTSEKRLRINVATKTDSVKTSNIVAVWQGDDPVLQAEYVALGAHYDHLGIGNPIKGDSIYNGADDNASGTTSLLAMAEALAQAPSRPKRSILFVWHCGEEKGLWGSRYFTENPTVALDQVVTEINLDMIGRSKRDGDTNPRNQNLSGPNEIYVIGRSLMSTQLGELIETVNKSFLNLAYNFRYDDLDDPNRFFFRSDHYSYARKGIPIIAFFDGIHEDYHQPGDSSEKIDYQKLEKVTKTIYMTMWEIANTPTRPKVDKPLPARLTSCRCPARRAVTAYVGGCAHLPTPIHSLTLRGRREVTS